MGVYGSLRFNRYNPDETGRYLSRYLEVSTTFIIELGKAIAVLDPECKGGFTIEKAKKWIKEKGEERYSK